MFTYNVLTIMFQGRKPSRTIKLNIRDGEKLPCPLGVLRGTKDIGACTQIKNISNKSLLIINIKLFSLILTFALLFFVSRDRTHVPRTQLPLANHSL